MSNGMTPGSLARYACPVAAAACLAGGLALAGHVLAASMALLAALSMLLTTRRPAIWLATTSLAVQVVLAAAGMLFHAAPLLVLAGAAFALAAWDLAVEAITRPREAMLHDVKLPAGRLPVEPAPPAVPPPPAGFPPPDPLLERYHLRSLALTLGAGLLLAAIGQNFQLRLPFIAILIAIGLGVWALERFLRSLS